MYLRSSLSGFTGFPVGRAEVVISAKIPRDLKSGAGPSAATYATALIQQARCNRI
jgi:hypothetical protein